MGAQLNIFDRNLGVLGSGGITASDPFQIGVDGGGGVRVNEAPIQIIATVAADADGVLSIWQAKSRADLGTGLGPPADLALVQEDLLAHTAGAPTTLVVAPVFPFVRVLYTNGGVATTALRIWVSVDFR